MVRGDEVEKGHFQLDPCNLHDGQAEIVRDRLVVVVADASAGRLAEPDQNIDRNRDIQELLRWPD